MKLAFLTLFLAGILAQTPPQLPAPAPAPKALELPAPQTVATGAGYLKITAKSGTECSWDVFAVFADPAVQVQFDVLPGNLLILGIPASAGAIRIVAAASMGDGKPPAIASTIVTIAPAEKPASAGGNSPPATPAAPSASSAQPAGTSWHVTQVGGTESPALRQALEAAGIKYWYYGEGDPKLSRRPDVGAQLTKVGSLPALVVQDGNGKVLAAVKLPATDSETVALINKLRGGK